MSEKNNFFTTIREVAQNNNPAITDAEQKGINNTVSTLEEQTKQLFESPKPTEKNKEEVVTVKETEVVVKEKKIFGLKPVQLILTALAISIAGYYTIKYFKNKPVAPLVPLAPINN